MKNLIQKIAINWNSNHRADLPEILTIEKALNISFPKNYIAFLKWSNGGEGSIGENYVSLWKCEDLVTLNNEYQIQKYLSEKFLGLGTDGGGICYGFRLNDYAIFKCPLGDLDMNEVVMIASSFENLFEKAISEKL